MTKYLCLSFLFLLTLNSCTPVKGSNELNLEEGVSANLFPSATSAMVYSAQDTIEVDADGKVFDASSAYQPAGKHIRQKAKSGGALTPEEIITLRRSVFYAPPPATVAGCCFPRHAFTFYDKKGNFLGYLTVCFECGCAFIEPASFPSPSLDNVEWDRNRIGSIVTAHRLLINPNEPLGATTYQNIKNFVN